MNPLRSTGPEDENAFTPGATHHASGLFKTQATCTQGQQGRKYMLVSVKALMPLVTPTTATGLVLANSYDFPGDPQ